MVKLFFVTNKETFRFDYYDGVIFVLIVIQILITFMYNKNIIAITLILNVSHN